MKVLHEVYTVKIREIIFVVTKQVQKCPRNRITNKKISSFELKWAKSQTKAQKSSKDDFIRETVMTRMGDREIGGVFGRVRMYVFCILNHFGGGNVYSDDDVSFI